MTLYKSTSTFLMALALLFSIGCASTATQESTGEYIDDSVITSQIKARLLKEPTLKSFEIKVETFKGIVQLSGFISPQINSDKAVEIARSVEGVKSVKNDMRSK